VAIHQRLVAGDVGSHHTPNSHYNDTFGDTTLDQIETPCIGTCKIDQATRLCLGCFRSIDEITAWTALSPSERANIMTALPGRQNQGQDKQTSSEAQS
ncbi:MAG: DUF1289 domain-containing protein, partial [Pseudomonadota bacterium]